MSLAQGFGPKLFPALVECPNVYTVLEDSCVTPQIEISPSPTPTVVKPTGEGQRTVLYIEGKVVDVQAAGGHHLDRLEVLHLPMVEDIDVWNIRGLPHIHAARKQGKGNAESRKMAPQEQECSKTDPSTPGMEHHSWLQGERNQPSQDGGSPWVPFSASSSANQLF